MEAFEGSKDLLKSLGEKAKSLSKVVMKEAKKAAGLHVGTVSEANPRYYLVIAEQGAMVRKDIELDSAPVHGLRRGDLVTCVDISGRRAKIIDPVEGWVSIKTQDNEAILEMTIAPDKRTQVSQMERRFEKLKAEQAGEQKDSFVLTPPEQSVSTNEPDAAGAASAATIKSKLTFKSTGAESSLIGATDKPAFVPKLGGPGFKKPPIVSTAQTSQPPDLFSFDSPKNRSQQPSQPLLIPSLVAPARISKPTESQKAPSGGTVAWSDPFADLLPPATTTPLAANVQNGSDSAGLSQGPAIQKAAQVGSTKNELDGWFN